MGKNRLFALAASLLVCSLAQAQVVKHAHGYQSWGCDGPYMEERAKLVYPHLIAQEAEIDAALAKAARLETLKSRMATAGSSAEPDYIIPVVVHVCTTSTGAGYVSPAQIQGAIDVLNRDYRKRNADTSVIDSRFAPLSIDSKIEFRLATSDPSGICSPGYTYINYANSASAGEDVKRLVMWPRERYLNVWVVDRIASGAGGYAYRPQNATTSNDGIVVVETQFGPGRGNFSERTLTHEVGHWLGLPHTWGGSNTPGLASNCNMDDGVTDTPNTTGVSDQSCNKNYAPCGVVSNVENYMDYSNCARMFTTGQINLMRNVLETIPFRRNLWQPANWQLTGIAPTLTSFCQPSVKYLSGIRDICVGASVQLSAEALTSPADTGLVSWTFDGPVPLAATGRTALVQFLAPGQYNVTVRVFTTTGADSMTVNQTLFVREMPAQVSAPTAWDFTTTPYTTVGSQLSSSWASASTGNARFRFVNQAGNGVNELAIVGLQSDERAYLVSPLLNIQPLANDPGLARLYYRRAASRAVNTATDEMRVQISRNCGESWQLLRVHTASITGPGNFYTASTLRTGSWTPAPEEWMYDSVSINNYRNDTAVLIRFEIIARGGNRVLLDDISIGTIRVTDAAERLQGPVSSFQVAPNPNSGRAQIQLSLATSTEAQLEVTDLVGRRIGSRNLGKLAAGEHSFPLESISNLTQGLYLVHVRAGGRTQVIRTVVQ